MKLGILGCRGIPNRYGGFEQFAEKLSVGLAQRGVDVWVYNSHRHPCREKEWKDVRRLFCYDPESWAGQAGQFIYDLNCIRNSYRHRFDVILQLGYTSSSVWFPYHPDNAIVVTNMDGLEWKRNKYNKPVRRFLKYAERRAVLHSHHLVADSPVISDYLNKTYQVRPSCIAYGADIPAPMDPALLRPYELQSGGYYLLIARLQADNHVEEIIRGVLLSRPDKPLVVVGNTRNPYGRKLTKSFHGQAVRFLHGIYDPSTLDALRQHAFCYFHGHSAGGTNPSLLEAMASSVPICAHENSFNRTVLGEDALYFSSVEDIARCLQDFPSRSACQHMIANNLEKIRARYNWEGLIASYHRLFNSLLANSRQD